MKKKIVDSNFDGEFSDPPTGGYPNLLQYLSPKMRIVFWVFLSWLFPGTPWNWLGFEYLYIPAAFFFILMLSEFGVKGIIASIFTAPVMLLSLASLHGTFTALEDYGSASVFPRFEGDFPGNLHPELRRKTSGVGSFCGGPWSYLPRITLAYDFTSEGLIRVAGPMKSSYLGIYPNATETLAYLPLTSPQNTWPDSLGLFSERDRAGAKEKAKAVRAAFENVGMAQVRRYVVNEDLEVIFLGLGQDLDVKVLKGISPMGGVSIAL